MEVSPKPDDGKRATRRYNKVASIITEGHTSEDWEWSVELERVSYIMRSAWTDCQALTLAPILPLIVITTPMIVLPSTRAPIANLQLRPPAIMEDAGW